MTTHVAIRSVARVVKFVHASARIGRWLGRGLYLPVTSAPLRRAYVVPGDTRNPEEAMQMKRAAAGLVLLMGCAVPGRVASADGDPPAAKSAPAEERPVDLCLCLDTSNSMDGLIDAAKRKLWDVVNDLARVQPKPHLRVALLSYGNNGYPKDEGWVRTDSPFTEDLDFISERLFALKTWGGEEYVGRVLDLAPVQAGLRLRRRLLRRPEPGC